MSEWQPIETVYEFGLDHVMLSDGVQDGFGMCGPSYVMWTHQVFGPKAKGAMTKWRPLTEAEAQTLAEDEARFRAWAVPA